MIDWSSCSVVESDPERMSGAWVFRGTRVPVAALFQNIEDGAQLFEFLVSGCNIRTGPGCIGTCHALSK